MAAEDAEDGWEVFAQEYFERATTARWFRPSVGRGPLRIRRDYRRRYSAWNHTWKGLFLPEGYPDSVSPDYLAFQVWDSVQGLCSYCRGVLTTQAIMVGLGVGEEAATPLGATFTWVMKDLVGMLGGICFSLVQGSGLDSNAKQWRYFADCMNNIGLALELASPLFPSLFWLFICAGSVSRALTGVAAGATRASMTQHFARAGNAADIAAKEGSQETCVTLVGMLVGMLLGKLVAEYAVLVWPLFLLLTALHLYSNMRAVRCLQLNALNRERAELALAAFMATGKAPAPADIASMESLLPGQQACVRWIKKMWSGLRQRHVAWWPTINLGARLSEVPQDQCDQLLRTGNTALNAAYLVASSPQRVHVVLHLDLQPSDLLESFIHALVYRKFLADDVKDEHAQEKAHAWMHDRCALFQEALVASGWNLHRVILCPSGWRAKWEREVPSIKSQTTHALHSCEDENNVEHSSPATDIRRRVVTHMGA